MTHQHRSLAQLPAKICNQAITKAQPKLSTETAFAALDVRMYVVNMLHWICNHQMLA